MENPQMGMPAEMAAQGPGPEEMAIFDQMRQEISPQEFSNEMLAGASQVDPQAVAEFTQELQGLDMPPEVLDALNDVVDEILANPERYDELRAQYIDLGLPEDILPEQFDPNFFAALNMAIDQMIAAPTGVQAFAKGGIAELKPIAKAIASYGRNGDTMLAHITPAEARMLRRRGGSGTINPDTGLPEFFLKGLFKGVSKAFKSIGKAVKKFVSSTVGRIVTTMALGFFLGPSAASLMNVGAGTVAGMAISGFVGGAGSTLLAGGQLKDALKAGAIAGLTAGAVQGLSGAPLTGAATMTPGEALQVQVGRFANAMPGGITPPPSGAGVPGLGPGGAAPVPTAIAGPTAPGAEFGIGDPGAGFEPYSEALANTPARMPTNAAAPTATGTPAGGGFSAKDALTDSVTTTGQRDAYISQQGLDKPPSLVDQAKDFYSKNISPSGIQEAGQESAMSKTLARFPGSTPEQIMNAPANSVLGKAYAANMPGILSTYGPMAAVGLGTLGALGGFQSKPLQGGAITNSLMKPVTQRIAEEGSQRQMYMQGLPGVQYDKFGAPIFGGSTLLPTYDVPDYNSGGFGLSSSGEEGIMDLPPVYNSPAGSIGSRRVLQPYNNAYMYSNLIPRRAAEGGYIQNFAEGGVAETTDIFRRVLGRDPTSAEFERWQPTFKDGMDVKKWTAFTEDPGIAEQRTAYNVRSTAEREATLASQKANRDRIAQEKAMKKAGGSGQMYSNMNAGLSVLAPETNPMDATDKGFGARNREAGLAKLQTTYAPMLQGQKNAMNQQAGIAASGQLPRDLTGNSGQDNADLYRGLARQGLTDPQIRAAAENRYGMLPDAAWKDIQADVADPTRNTKRPGAVMPPVDAGGPITTMPVTPPPGSSIDTGVKYSNQDIQSYLKANPNMSDKAIYDAMNKFGISTAQMAEATGTPRELVDARYNYVGSSPAAPEKDQFGRTALSGSFEGETNPFRAADLAGAQRGGYSNQDIQKYLAANPGLTDAEIRQKMDQFGVGTAQMASATGLPINQIQQRYNATLPTKFLNMGGIAGLGAGGYPRRTGQISGPGTEKSDSIPAMLSDGEFVMTAKAVRGAGKGSRRAGAKQMYKLMHQLEKNSERG